MWPFRRDDSVGPRGEKLAARTLKRAGCRILARNYRCPAGEADLIALDGETVVFAEVKTRRSDAWADPADAVDERKRQHYRRIARYYLSCVRQRREVRFDVISIVLPDDGEPRITHVRDAFA